MNKSKTWMSWSTGKDSAFALYRLLLDSSYQVTQLLTTITEPYQRVSMHGVREELLDLQSKALNLAVYKVKIPEICTNEIYSEKMKIAILDAQKNKITHFGFGDLFLEDIKEYRETQFSQTGINALFPIWKRNTYELAQEMLKLGFESIVTCIDTRKVPISFLGRKFTTDFIKELPDNVDPCGENGEFHTFVYDAPIFHERIHVNTGEKLIKGDFAFIDVLPKNTTYSTHRVIEAG